VAAWVARATTSAFRKKAASPTPHPSTRRKTHPLASEG
jgi:hypothetical protein